MSPSRCAPGILNSICPQIDLTFAIYPPLEAPKFQGHRLIAKTQTVNLKSHFLISYPDSEESTNPYSTNLPFLFLSCQGNLLTMDTPKLLQLSSASIMTDLENSSERFKSEPKYYFPPKTPLYFYKPALSVSCYPRGKCISFQLTELDISQYIGFHAASSFQQWPGANIFCTYGLGLSLGMLGGYAHEQIIFTPFLCAQIK